MLFPVTAIGTLALRLLRMSSTIMSSIISFRKRSEGELLTVSATWRAGSALMGKANKAAAKMRMLCMLAFSIKF